MWYLFYFWHCPLPAIDDYLSAIIDTSRGSQDWNQENLEFLLM